jgi:hypothetical protein
MVSMQPNTQRYNYTYTWEKLCNKPKYAEIDQNTIYDVLKRDARFSKTLRLVHKANLKNFLRGMYDGYTLFVTEDKNIPDSFVDNADLFTAETLINSYILDGIADIDYIIKNGSSVYIPRKYKYENPILIIVEQDSKRVHVNKVGRLIEQLDCSNGVIQVMDNIGQVSYIN